MAMHVVDIAPMDDDVDESAYLTLAQAAAYLSVSESLLEREFQCRRLTGFKPCRRLLRFRKEHLDAWMMRGLIEATEPTPGEIAVSMNPVRTRRRRVPRETD